MLLLIILLISEIEYLFYTPNHDDIYDYALFTTDYDRLVFKVKAKNDAHLLFATNPDFDKLKKDKYYEIVIGGARGQRLFMRIGDDQLINDQLPDLLDENKFLDYWVSWSNETVDIGKGTKVGENRIGRMEKKGPKFKVNAVALNTGWNAQGQWKISKDNSNFLINIYKSRVNFVFIPFFFLLF